MSRNAIQWCEKPKFPDTHYVDTRIYTDEDVFREEQEKIFAKCWIIACHESELPGAYDYRTFRHPSGVPLIIVRGEDMKVRSFYNICPHRGNTLLYDPVGNAKRISCIFHAWSFDTKGNCIDISREKQGYQERFKCQDAGLREVKTDFGYGGFVWVNLDYDSSSLS
jgi:methanesulfonate monooxygenase large subunit